MSSYIDCTSPVTRGRVGVNWADFTHKRIFWLYGHERAWAVLKGQDHATNIDVGKWNALGRRSAA